MIVTMNHVKILITTAVIILSACDGGGRDNGEVCLQPEDIANSECPTTDLFLVCNQYFCGVFFPADGDNGPIIADYIFPPSDMECLAIDCTTLDCEGVVFSELRVNEFGSPEFKVILPDGRKSDFSSCGAF